MFTIRHDDLSGKPSRRLLALQLRGLHAGSPPGHALALDLPRLTAPGVSVRSVWDGDLIVAIGALRRLPDGTGEVKSMRTHPDQLRRGAAALLLHHVVAEARQLGLARLSLENGQAFEPALALCRRRGFADGEAFSDCQRGDFNQFLHLTL